jgi:uncharacterized protein YneF (UPF0154 family)
MERTKTVVLFVLVGAILGAVIASAVMPRYIEWDNTPATGQALCNCPEVVRSTASRVIGSQLWFGLVGGVAGLVGGIFFVRMMAKRAAKNPAPHSPAPPASP